MLYSGKDLRKLIIPLLIEQVLAIAVGMADTIMVSAAGETAVSGVSLTFHHQMTGNLIFDTGPDFIAVYKRQ